MKWKIGNVKIDNQVVLAPMAGICELTFRRIIKSMGCGLIETEMVSDRGIIHDNTRTQDMLEMTECERPISQQIFGSEAETMKKHHNTFMKTCTRTSSISIWDVPSEK